MRGTPDNGLQFQVVQAKNVHAVWLIRIANSSKKLFRSAESTLHEEEPCTKGLHMPLTSSL